MRIIGVAVSLLVPLGDCSCKDSLKQEASADLTPGQIKFLRHLRRELDPYFAPRKRRLDLEEHFREYMVNPTFRARVDELVGTPPVAVIWTSEQSLDLNHTNVVDLSPLVTLEGLKELDLSHTRVHVLPVGFEKLQSLKDLNLSHTLVEDISPLGDLERLIRLDLSHTRVRQIPTHLTVWSESLKELNLSSTPVDEIDPLCQLESLRKLDLSNTRVREIPAAVHRMESLVELNLSATQVTAETVVALAQIVPLKKLNLSHNPQLVNVDALALSENLKELDLSFTGVDNVNVLTELDGLRSLDVSHTGLRAIPARFENLRELNMSHNQLENIDALGGLPAERWHLRVLDLSHNPAVRNINALAHLRSLEKLNLSFTAVDNITPLVRDGFEQNLTWLDLTETQVQDIPQALAELVDDDTLTIVQDFANILK